MKEDFDPIWVAPDVSPEIAQFIQSARLIMLTMNDGEVIKRAIASGQTLAQGASAFIAQTINLVESKLGELSPDDNARISAAQAKRERRALKRAAIENRTSHANEKE